MSEVDVGPLEIGAFFKQVRGLQNPARDVLIWQLHAGNRHLRVGARRRPQACRDHAAARCDFIARKGDKTFVSALAADKQPEILPAFMHKSPGDDTMTPGEA